MDVVRAQAESLLGHRHDVVDDADEADRINANQEPLAPGVPVGEQERGDGHRDVLEPQRAPRRLHARPEHEGQRRQQRPARPERAHVAPCAGERVGGHQLAEPRGSSRRLRRARICSLRSGRVHARRTTTRTASHESASPSAGTRPRTATPPPQRAALETTANSYGPAPREDCGACGEGVCAQAPRSESVTTAPAR